MKMQVFMIYWKMNTNTGNQKALADWYYVIAQKA